MVPQYSADVGRATVQTVVAAGASASVIITVARTYAGLATGHSASSIYTLYLTMKHVIRRDQVEVSWVYWLLHSTCMGHAVAQLVEALR